MELGGGEVLGFTAPSGDASLFHGIGAAGHPGGFFEMTLFLLILEILDAWTRSQKVLHCPVAWTGVKVTTAWGHREAASEPIGVRGFLLKF